MSIMCITCVCVCTYVRADMHVLKEIGECTFDCEHTQGMRLHNRNTLTDNMRNTY